MSTIKLQVTEINNLMLHTYSYIRDPKAYAKAPEQWTSVCLDNAMVSAGQWALDNQMFDDVFLYYLDNDLTKVVFKCILTRTGISTISSIGRG